jgi:hypothetical protein
VTAAAAAAVVGLIPPWDQMLQNVPVGKNPTALVDWSHRCVGLIPPWDQMLQNVPVGKNPVVHADPPHPPVPRASPAAARHRQPQQTPYLGEFAETPESAATSLELLFSATTLRPAIFQQVPSATVILAQSAFRRLPRSVQHIPAPSPLAQASVRSPLTLQKERTRKLQVHMGLAASAIACLSPPDDR